MRTQPESPDVLNQDSQINKRTPGRYPYSPPKLRTFGPVGVLTQGGTGNMIEGAMGMGMMMGINNPNRRP